MVGVGNTLAGDDGVGVRAVDRLRARWQGHDHLLLDILEGDLLAVLAAGAYGASMASNYNSRPRPAEVLVDGKDVTVCRRRETYADLYRAEIEA